MGSSWVSRDPGSTWGMVLTLREPMPRSRLQVQASSGRFSFPVADASVVVLRTAIHPQSVSVMSGSSWMQRARASVHKDYSRYFFKASLKWGTIIQCVSQGWRSWEPRERMTSGMINDRTAAVFNCCPPSIVIFGSETERRQ